MPSTVCASPRLCSGFGIMHTEEGTINTKVYRKKTHTDQYLSYQSHHPLEHKRSVVNTLMHRAETIINQESDKKDEIDHLKKVLSINGYPNWLIKKEQQKVTQAQTTQESTDNSNTEKHNRLAVVPYIKNLSERIRAILKEYNIATAFRPETTLRKILVHPKDKTSKLDKTGVVYKIKCQKCPQDYIGETLRKTKLRIQQHRRPSEVEKSPMAHHIIYNKHKLDIEQVQILDQEPDWHKRGIKEAIYIRQQHPSLNRDEGRHKLSRAWDTALPI